MCSIRAVCSRIKWFCSNADRISSASIRDVYKRQEHTTDIGEAIAKGLCKYLGAAYVPAARQEAPKPAEPAQGDTLYRVQVGAFAVRALSLIHILTTC